MIILNDVMVAAQCKVNDGCEYGWDWAGEFAYLLTFTVDPTTTRSREVVVVFDRKTQQVYSIEVWGTPEEKKYFQWIDPTKALAFEQESLERGVDPSNAIDESNFIIISDDNEILRIIQAAMNNENLEEFADADLITLSLSNEELVALSLMAHAKDVTLNQMVNSILHDFVKDPENFLKGI